MTDHLLRQAADALRICLGETSPDGVLTLLPMQTLNARHVIVEIERHLAAPQDDPASDPKPARFYILSLKHTRRSDENLTWWRPDSKGYCWSITDAGLYDENEAIEIQNGSAFEGVRSSVAVPEHIARSLAHFVVSVSETNFIKLGTSGEEWRKVKP